MRVSLGFIFCTLAITLMAKGIYKISISNVTSIKEIIEFFIDYFMQFMLTIVIFSIGSLVLYVESYKKEGANKWSSEKN